MITFSEVIARLDELDDELAIYASPWPRWSATSRAAVAIEPADGSLPEQAAGLTYLLTVAVAQCVVERARLRNPRATTSELCHSVLYFVRHEELEPTYDAAV